MLSSSSEPWRRQAKPAAVKLFRTRRTDSASRPAIAARSSGCHGPLPPWRAITRRIAIDVCTSLMPSASGSRPASIASIHAARSPSSAVRARSARAQVTNLASSRAALGRYAVRTFTVDRRRGVLAPVSIAPHSDNIGVDGRAVWEGGVCEARCAHGHDHTAPDETCTCGIYGATSLGSLRSQFPDLAAGIVAVIAAEGTTIIGSAGLRTSAARVVAYWCHPGPAFDDARKVFAKQCGQAHGFDDLGAMLAAHNIPATTDDSLSDLITNMHCRISLTQLKAAEPQRFWSLSPDRLRLAERLRQVCTIAAQRQLRKLGFNASK